MKVIGPEGCEVLTIDRASAIPVYRQIYNDINERVQSGDFSLGSMLPSESRLSSQYGVERATVRRALALLVDEGKAEKIPGLGTTLIDRQETPGAVTPRTTKTMMFLLPRGRRDADRINESFNAKLLATMVDDCADRGYELLYKSYTRDDTADDLISMCNPAGIFFISYLPVDLYKQLKKRKIPAVLVNQDHPLFPAIGIDNRGGSKLVVEYFLSLGHQKIGFIDGHADDAIASSRYRGYRDTLRSNGLELNSDWVVSGDWTIEGGRLAMRELLKKAKTLPTAIYSSNDSMAIGAIREANEAGLNVPEDISFVGFDNIDQCEFVNPKLSSVAMDYHAMTSAACMLMFDMLEHDSRELNVNIYVPLHLIERESVREMPV